MSPVVQDVVRSPGHPLPSDTRAFMASRFGGPRLAHLPVPTQPDAAERVADRTATEVTSGASAAEPFIFGASRWVGEELSVLELDDVKHADGVTVEAPLVLRLDQPLAPGELVLPVAFDGEDYLPLGYAVSVPGGTELRLSRLPAQTPISTRSLGGSLKILFRKLVLRKLGFDFPYPLLSLVTYPGGPPHYEPDPDVIRPALRTAQRVLLVVHGIIGDTLGMTEFLNAGPDPIRNHYDAVLALDYENINSPVSETAAAVAARMNDIVLGNGHSPSASTASARSAAGSAHCSAASSSSTTRWTTCSQVRRCWPNSRHPARRRASTTSPSPATNRSAPEAMPSGPSGFYASSGCPSLRSPCCSTEHRTTCAVSVPSASGVGQHWPTRPDVLDAECNHLEFFASTRGISAMRRALEL